MEYFKKLLDLLKVERNEDRQQYQQQTAHTSVVERRSNGLVWYPVAIRGSEMTRGEYLNVELERTTHQEISHQFRSRVPAFFFSNHDPKTDRVEGVVTFVGGNKLKITINTDELPDWARDGKLGVELLFDESSYDHMNDAIKAASELSEKSTLIKILTGQKSPTFQEQNPTLIQKSANGLNEFQQKSIRNILHSNELSIVHGPPGTGKTTTLVQAIKRLVIEQNEKVLVVAPSNNAVDLLSEKLHQEGLNVLRVGNPSRVSEELMSLTLDEKIQQHGMLREAKKLKKQAAEFKNMAHKYKRSFGRAEAEQRKALLAEAHKIMKEVEKLEEFAIEDVVAKSQVLTGTLVGANHYTVRNFSYKTVVIDEAGQALEPACWIPILKAERLVLAGDHCQLPPTIKSAEAAKGGLAETLLEKCVKLHPEAVTLLEEQYRMNEEIMQYSSKVFYHNLLKANASVAKHRVFTSDKPLLFVDTAGCSFDEKLEGTSSTNPDEAALLFKHLSQFIEENLSIKKSEDFPSIAIISPYKQQVGILEEQFRHSPDLQKYKHKIAVNTIDSFQGQERDIVYISLVRSNDKGEIGFLADIRRMNVAMTRARKKLVVLGDSATLSVHDFYGDFIDYAQSIDGYQSAWELM